MLGVFANAEIQCEESISAYFLSLAIFFLRTFRYVKQHQDPNRELNDPEFKSEFMKAFPIPPITDANQSLVGQIETLVDEIIAAKTTTPDADVISLENEIDCVVYSLYGLTAEEIAIVEESQ